MMLERVENDAGIGAKKCFILSFLNYITHNNITLLHRFGYAIGLIQL
jgi:hypothetical protein